MMTGVLTGLLARYGQAVAVERRDTGETAAGRAFSPSWTAGRTGSSGGPPPWAWPGRTGSSTWGSRACP